MVAKRNFVFATDCYHAESIKGQERLRRGCSPKFVVDGPATRTPADFKVFLSNEDNKMQLCHLLLQVWKGEGAASRLKDIPTAIAIVDGRAQQLTSSDGNVSVTEIKELASNQEETDTRVILYLQHAVKLGFKSAVVRSPDTDILLILLHHASSIPLTIFFDTGSGKHRRIINISTLALKIGEQRCTMLLGLYVFTGEDATSAFKGKGKVGPAKKLQSLPEFQDAFRTLGDNWSVNSNTAKAIEAFTCRMYGNKKETSVNVLRGIMLRRMVGEDEPLTSKSRVDFSRLPPCHDNLIPHLQRVNHRLAHYKRAGMPMYQSPKPHDPGQGWERTENGMLEPMWSCGPILPPSLVDLLPDAEDDQDHGELIEDQDIDWDDLSDDED